jgi:hypothetical protein
MNDYSIFERNHPVRTEQTFGIAFGRITSVDSKNRLCSVSTFMGAGSMNDQYIKNCQWLNLDTNAEGDEGTTVPRRGSIGLVFWIDGEPFIGLYFKPIKKGGIPVKGTEYAKLNEGDKVFSTMAGNRILIKTNGMIELFSKSTLSRTMIPLGSQIIDICRKYELTTDSGYMRWNLADKLTQQTLFEAEYARDLLRTFVVQEKKGGVSDDILQYIVAGIAGPGMDTVSAPVFEQTLKITGEMETFITPPVPSGTPIGFHSLIQPDGTVLVEVGPMPQFSFSLSPSGATEIAINQLLKITMTESGLFEIAGPTASLSLTDTGDMVAKNPTCEISAKSSGDMTISNPAVTVTITAAGELTLEAKQKITLEAKAGIDVKSSGPVNLEAMGPVSIKGQGEISLDGGTGASDYVLTYPTTLSPFTGAPLMPYSMTVKVSK